MAARGGDIIRPGHYLRYDGSRVEVLYVTADIDSGGEVVVCRDTDCRVYTITKQSFLARTEYQGKFVTKYVPREREQTERRPRQARDYESYARDLCEHFGEDLRRYKLCVEQKQYVIPREDFQAIKEDISFLTNCLRTVLSPYSALFKGRFVEGLSIRKYAAASDTNRGSVDYAQKKLFAALAEELRARDIADGKNRLAAPEDKK